MDISYTDGTDIEIPDYAPAAIELPNGWAATIRIDPDDSMGEPWKEHDGHGIVSEWTRRDKRPGERVLAEDRGSYRYYDFAESVRIARRDGWGAEEGKTLRERAALAAERDFARLKAWCNDEWGWVGVVVEIERPDGWRMATSLWGIESDGDYWRDVAKELLADLLAETTEESK